ncbi:hypothetical protein HY633_01120 [Candidatus Uhrbacteria bacterium]|nr:hypothetical protein [Candidatus Uhrbacteria bacterium]
MEMRNPQSASRRSAASPGTVLLLAILVMTAVVTTSVGLSSLIMSSLRQSRAIDSSIMGYYAAESGAEDALYYARRLGTLPADVAAPVALGNGAAWTRDVSGTEQVIFANVPEDSFVHLDLFDPDNETTAPCIARVQVDWDPGNGAALRTTLMPWSPGSPFNWDQNAVTTNYAGGSISIPLDQTKLYALRLRALHATLTDVSITAYGPANSCSSGEEIKPLPGRVSIDSIGEFGSSRQRLNVTLPRRTPLSGVYDFVIFSECSLVKGGTISCP